MEIATYGTQDEETRQQSKQVAFAAHHRADRRAWRLAGATLARVRKLIKEADPKIMEEWKWRGVPVWSDNGIVCTGESYKAVVKLTFAKGAFIEDPTGMFNASLGGNARCAIDLREGDKLNESAFKKLIRAAVKLNAKGKQ